MQIAVLSGKGGTGKTTVAASLAMSLPNCQYIDCDVEEPNGAIFIKPKLEKPVHVKVAVPLIDMDKCDLCGLCGKACQFNAIAVTKKDVILFPEICHHCGACVLACPLDAISEVERTVGIVEGNADETFLHGKLNVGEPISIPILSELKSRIKRDMPVVLDSPPGASCGVVETIDESDYCILVTEPTPFGLHDVKIAVNLTKRVGLPFGVVLNKASTTNTLIHDFCREEKIDLLMEIPYAREIAANYSKGLLPIVDDLVRKEEFVKLYEKIERSVAK